MKKCSNSKILYFLILTKNFCKLFHSFKKRLNLFRLDLYKL